MHNKQKLSWWTYNYDAMIMINDEQYENCSNKNDAGWCFFFFDELVGLSIEDVPSIFLTTWLNGQLNKSWIKQIAISSSIDHQEFLPF